MREDMVKVEIKPLVLLGLLLAGGSWIAESALHSFVFHQSAFPGNLIPGSVHELWMRSVVFFLFAGFGFYAQSQNDRRMAAEARNCEEQFRKLVDSSPEAIALHRDSKLIYVNAATLKLLGAREAGEIVGQPVLSLVHPDDREEADKRIRQIFESGTSSYRVEEKLMRLDGESFLAEITAIPVKFEGAPAAMVLGRDITERKRWENELQASLLRIEEARNEAEEAGKREQEQARLLERIFQHAHECIVVLDREFNFVRVNQAYADACRREIGEFAGHNHFELYPSPLIEDFRRVAATGTPYQAYSRPFVFPDHPDWGVGYWDLSLVPITSPDGKVELLLFTLKDVTDRHRAEAALSLTNRTLHVISACDSLLVHSSTEAELLDGMCRLLVETNGYSMAWIGYAEDDAYKTIRMQAHAGNGSEFVNSTRFSWGDGEYGLGPSGAAIRTGQTVVVHNTKMAESGSWCELACASGYLSAIALPLHGEGRVLGMLSIYSGEPDVFNDEEVRLLEQLADDLSFGIESLRSGVARKQAEGKITSYIQQLEESMQGTLQAVSNMVEQRDPYTAGHERRVGVIAADIARELGWAEEKCRELYLIGLVHDIGKISIPSEILSKPGRLSLTEYELVKGHVERGYEILKDVRFPMPIAEIIRQHHEHMDGSGYPRGLQGEQILPEARIIAVADILESMSSHRPYRAALGVEVAVQEIMNHRGSFYDADVVDVALRLIRDKSYQLPA